MTIRSDISTVLLRAVHRGQQMKRFGSPIKLFESDATRGTQKSAMQTFFNAEAGFTFTGLPRSPDPPCATKTCAMRDCIGPRTGFALTELPRAPDAPCATQVRELTGCSGTRNETALKYVSYSGRFQYLGILFIRNQKPGTIKRTRRIRPLDMRPQKPSSLATSREANEASVVRR
jgi:hypothetical protein